MFNAHTAAIPANSGIYFVSAVFRIQAVSPKTNKSPAHMKKEEWKPAAADTDLSTNSPVIHGPHPLPMKQWP
ncbi:hypothetical protein [Peribacillus simplex]|uniref:hypothetical protein n=1 Tax=Peribacillus simplex TaxID=1478 RepID=UPI003D2AE875